MPTSTSDVVQRLCNLCHVLRDDGITYHQYVTKLTFLLFLKMIKETGAESRSPRATAGAISKRRPASGSSRSIARC